MDFKYTTGVPEDHSDRAFEGIKIIQIIMELKLLHWMSELLTK